MNEENIPSRGARLGEIVKSRFESWSRSYFWIGDVRGLGAMVAMEVVSDRDSKQPDKDRTARVLVEALKRGLILLSAGTYGNVVRILVPLTIEDAVLEEGLGMMEQALGAS